MARVVGKLISLRQQRHFAGEPLFFEQARNNEPIATVIAFPGNDQHPLFHITSVALYDCSSDAFAGALHQREARHAVLLNRQPLHLAHLFGGDDDHRNREPCS